MTIKDLQPEEDQIFIGKNNNVGIIGDTKGLNPYEDKIFTGTNSYHGVIGDSINQSKKIYSREFLLKFKNENLNTPVNFPDMTFRDINENHKNNIKTNKKRKKRSAKKV